MKAKAKQKRELKPSTSKTADSEEFADIAKLFQKLNDLTEKVNTLSQAPTKRKAHEFSDSSESEDDCDMELEQHYYDDKESETEDGLEGLAIYTLPKSTSGLVTAVQVVSLEVRQPQGLTHKRKRLLPKQ